MHYIEQIIVNVDCETTPTSVRLGGRGMGETLVPSSLSSILSILDALLRGLVGSVGCLERGEDRIVGRISLNEGTLASVCGEGGEEERADTGKSTRMEEGCVIHAQLLELQYNDLLHVLIPDSVLV